MTKPYNVKCELPFLGTPFHWLALAHFFAWVLQTLTRQVAAES